MSMVKLSRTIIGPKYKISTLSKSRYDSVGIHRVDHVSSRWEWVGRHNEECQSQESEKKEER